MNQTSIASEAGNVKRRRTAHSVLGIVLSLVLTVPASARQTPPDPLKELNDSLQVAGTKDAAEILCPPLAAMAAPPASPAGLRKVSLLTPTDPEWTSWDTWAAAEPQQAVLAALKTITDPKSKFVFGLRFGRPNVPPDWAAADLFVDTGDPPLIALANNGMRYLSRLDTLMLLCTVEAERLAAADKPDECAELLVNWFRFCRIMAERPFAKEKIWAITQAESALERLGDIACAHPALFKEKTIQNINKDLDLRAVATERVRFPIGERLALKQLVALAIDERGGPKPDAFGPTLARLTADPHNAYDLFPQAAWWSEIGKQHAGWFDTRDMIEKVLNDWQKRWELNNIFDPIMATPTDYSKMDRLRFAMIDTVVRDVPRIFDLRTRVTTQLTGIRSALAVVGYKSAQGQWPPSLPSVQPRFVQKLDNDPWYWEKERDVRDIFRYFVPMRDQPVGPRELPKPHTIRVDMSGIADRHDSAVTASVVASIRKEFATLKSVASQVYDTATGTIDTSRFKEKWLEAAKAEARRIFSDQEELKNLQNNLTMIADVPVEQRLAALQAMFDLPETQSALTDEARTLGLTLEEFKSFFLAMNKAVNESEAFNSIVATVKVGSKPTLDAIEELQVASVEFATTPEMIETYLKKVVIALANPASVMTGPSITANLTDRDFVLYSVGPDMKADFAKLVGPNGPDILIWPPVLTLERRALKGN
ncbi:MAG: hypothetical protein JNK58_07380 [Phycisphaerae bacterium]|nr:hypothetical protein [Phycisphaerae bacterium]